MIKTKGPSMIVTQDDETIDQILSSVESICKKYPEKYWLELDKAQSYPTEFVKSMTESGHLNALIPTKYGGAGLSLLIAVRILEKIQSMNQTPEEEKSVTERTESTSQGEIGRAHV